jgi:hypothetical protein
LRFFSTTEGRGSFSHCFTETGIGSRFVLTSSLGVRSLVVPLMTAYVDENTGVLHGKAPPDTRLLIDVSADTNQDPSGILHRHVITTSASGTYSLSLPISGEVNSAAGNILYIDPQGNQLSLYFSTPRWQIELGSALVSGTGLWPGVPLTVTYLSADGQNTQIAYARTSSYNGSYHIPLGQRLYPGDHLTFAYPEKIYSITLPEFTANYDYAQGALTGQAPPFASLAMRLMGSSGFRRSLRAGADGLYGLDISDLVLPIGQRGWVETIDPQGNLLRVPFRAAGLRYLLPAVYR